MSASSPWSWPWVVLALLGAYHGLNPAMGWLFALALGLQEKRRSAVIGALLPIALGHAAAIAITVLALSIIHRVLPFHLLKWAEADSSRMAKAVAKQIQKVMISQKWIVVPQPDAPQVPAPSQRP